MISHISGDAIAMDYSTSKHEVTTRVRYDVVSRLLRWITLLLIVVQFTLGWLMPDADTLSAPAGLAAMHVSVGATLLVVVLVRLIWALFRVAPEEDDGSTVLRV